MTTDEHESEHDRLRAAIAEKQMEILRNHPEACATGRAGGWRWMRYRDGEWQAVRSGGKHRLADRKRGIVFTPEEARGWLIINPVTIHSTLDDDSYVNKTWADVEEQDVFTDRGRCFWCGSSDRTEPLDEHVTAAQGTCLFCPDCRDSWEKADELVPDEEQVA